MSEKEYDAVIVGAGIAGAIVALELGKAGKRVLVLESGPAVSANRSENLNTFFTSSAKTPESPYPPGPGADPGKEATPRPTVLDSILENLSVSEAGQVEGRYLYDPKKSYLLQKGPKPFLSTSERIEGGTTHHWLGSSVRMLENDFKMNSRYGLHKDWPLGAEELAADYGKAEQAVGVAADVNEQKKDLGSVGIKYSEGYEYPMRPVRRSLVDEAVAEAVDGCRFDGFDGRTAKVTQTPAGRNTKSYGSRGDAACAGNTNCIPICPIQAKYDATRTLFEAKKTGHVTVLTQCVVRQVHVGEDGRVSGLSYTRWENDGGLQILDTQSAKAKVYVLAAHAIETPRLLLMSKDEQRGALADGVANSSGLVGRNLMDHPIYLSWALAPKPVWGYRGPLSTTGIETLRDGPFRSRRSAWRVEIGNEGWSFPIGDPVTSTLEIITGRNSRSQLNPGKKRFLGDALVAKLNHDLTRQWRMAFLMDQSPDFSNRITLDESLTDGLGLPRPVVNYDLSDYTKLGFVFAEIFARHVYSAMRAKSYVRNSPKVPIDGGKKKVSDPSFFALKPEWREHFEKLPPELKTKKITNLDDDSGVPKGFKYYGAGHIMGTCSMGSNSRDSVVDKDLRTWDHDNLFVVGSSVFPTAATANPTMTLAALAYRAARSILQGLGGN